MEAIESVKDNPVCELKYVLKHARQGLYGATGKPLNEMSEEQIVLAWHGHAEVEKEYVSFDEAMKAYDKGHLVSFHPKIGTKLTVSFRERLKDVWLGDYSLNDLRKGKWSIEVGNL